MTTQSNQLHRERDRSPLTPAQAEEFRRTPTTGLPLHVLNRLPRINAADLDALITDAPSILQHRSLPVRGPNKSPWLRAASLAPALLAVLAIGSFGGPATAAGDPDPVRAEEQFQSGPAHLYRPNDDGGAGKRNAAYVKFDEQSRAITDQAALTLSLSAMDADELAALERQLSSLSWPEQAAVFNQIIAGTWSPPVEEEKGVETIAPTPPPPVTKTVSVRKGILSSWGEYTFMPTSKNATGVSIRISKPLGNSRSPHYILSSTSGPVPEVEPGNFRLWIFSYGYARLTIYQYPGGKFYFGHKGGVEASGGPAAAGAERVKQAAVGESSSSSSEQRKQDYFAARAAAIDAGAGFDSGPAELYADVSSQADADAANRRAAPEMNEFESRSKAQQQDIKAAATKAAGEAYAEMKSNGASDNEAADAATAAAQAVITEQIKRTRPVPAGEGGDSAPDDIDTGRIE